MWTTALKLLPIATTVATLVGLGLIEYERRRVLRRWQEKVFARFIEYDPTLLSKVYSVKLESIIEDLQNRETDSGTSAQRDQKVSEDDDRFIRKEDLHKVHPRTLDLLHEFDHRVVMQILMSLAALGVSFYIILSSSYDAGSKHWAYGTVGSLFGFWLKGTGSSRAFRREREESSVTPKRGKSNEGK
jgi:hypothetical protein